MTSTLTRCTFPDSNSAVVARHFASLEECKTLCKENEQCHFFSFRLGGTEVCNFYDNCDSPGAPPVNENRVQHPWDTYSFDRDACAGNIQNVDDSYNDLDGAMQ